jgi:hypothetical protein
MSLYSLQDFLDFYNASRVAQGRNGPRLPKLAHERNEPSPEHNLEPVSSAVAFLVATVSSKEAAANMTDKESAKQIIAAANAAIAEYIDGDDICPPWPYPGPPPWLSVIASELTLVANTLQEGSLRTNILQIAGQVLDRAQEVSVGKVGSASISRTRAA